MVLAEIIGTIVATRKHDLLVGNKIQIVQPIDPKSGKLIGTPLVAIDVVGAGVGERVIVVEGSSARCAVEKDDAPVDATIVGIIDQIDVEDNAS